MANMLKKEKQIMAISALCEGNSIRSIERMTGVHRDTIMRLGIRVGQGCQEIMDIKMKDLNSQRVQVDEIWGFVGKKQKNLRIDDSSEVGDVWTFVAIDADSKVVPAFRVGRRDSETANAFLVDLASRMKNRVQLSSDALRAYVDAVDRGFGGQVDYGQIVKSYPTGEATYPEHKYSPPMVVDVSRRAIVGNPKESHISTSYIERQNLTMRMHMRRLTRLTNAFSKKLKNFKAAVALHFVYYNFVKSHNTLRMTPAMAAGITNRFWSVSDIVKATA